MEGRQGLEEIVENSCIFTAAGILHGAANLEEDVDGNLYYMEHQPTMDNKMEIIKVEGERLKIRLTGITEDVNYLQAKKALTQKRNLIAAGRAYDI